MSEKEQTGQRDLTYSTWHRTDSLRRFLPHQVAFRCAMVDIDSTEYCKSCGAPLALVETQRSQNPPKSAMVTERLARDAGIPAFSLSYFCDESGEIVGFRVQKIAPEHGPIATVTPTVWAQAIAELREVHDCAESRAAS